MATPAAKRQVANSVVDSVPSSKRKNKKMTAVDRKRRKNEQRQTEQDADNHEEPTTSHKSLKRGKRHKAAQKSNSQSTSKGEAAGADELVAEQALFLPVVEQQPPSGHPFFFPSAVVDPAPNPLDWVTAVFPASSSASNPHSPLIAGFECFDGGSPSLFYLTLAGNEQAIARLRAIAADNTDEDFTVKIFRQQLSQQAVEELMAEQDEERLRRALTVALPEGPEGDGWGDRDRWTVGELRHKPLHGSVGLLPLEAPAGFPFDNYATQIFSNYLSNFVRTE